METQAKGQDGGKEISIGNDISIGDSSIASGNTRAIVLCGSLNICAMRSSPILQGFFMKQFLLNA